MPELVMGKNALHEDPADPEPEDARQMVQNAEMRLRKRQANQVADDMAYIKELLSVPWFLIEPEGPFMQRWDTVTALALLFTAVVTPFEVAVMENKDEIKWEDIRSDGLFWANTIVTVIFAVDVCLSFFVMFREEGVKGYNLVRSLPRIQRRYLSTWFILDVISVIPMSVIPGASKLGALRMIRILRLIKLIRVLRVSRIYQRFQARNTLPHATEAMMKQVFTLFIMAHWMACAWVLTGTMQDPSVWTWVDAYAESYVCPSDGCSRVPYRDELLTQPSRLYFGALYWSVVSTTSVGYGDITARNPEEMLLCTVYLLVSAIIWANIVGNIVAVISSGDPDLASHNQTLDKLNVFIAKQNLPKELGLRMRAYFNNRYDMVQARQHQELFTLLSPQLTEEVCENTANWLRGTIFFENTVVVSTAFLARVHNCFTEQLFEPHEVIAWNDCLRCLTHGVGTRQGQVFCPTGYIWGEDFLMLSKKLKDRRIATALSYATVLSLRREDLMKVLEDFPQEKDHVRRVNNRFIFRRAVLVHAYRLTKERAKESAPGLEPLSVKWKWCLGLSAGIEGSFSSSMDSGAAGRSFDYWAKEKDVEEKPKLDTWTDEGTPVPSTNTGELENIVSRVVKKSMRESSGGLLDKQFTGKLADQVMAQLLPRLDEMAAKIVAKSQAAAEQKFNELLRDRGGGLSAPHRPPRSPLSFEAAIQAEELDL